MSFDHLIFCRPPSPPALKSFPASGSFPVSQFFTSGGQNFERLDLELNGRRGWRGSGHQWGDLGRIHNTCEGSELGMPGEPVGWGSPAKPGSWEGASPWEESWGGGQ